MSNMAIDQVLAQIRALSSQAGYGLKPGQAAAQNAIAPPALPGAAGGAAPPQFAQLLKQSIDAVNETQQRASALAESFERGAPGVDLAQVMIESQKASVSFRALTEVRNRLVSAYQDIMNMSI